MPRKTSQTPQEEVSLSVIDKDTLEEVKCSKASLNVNRLGYKIRMNIKRFRLIIVCNLGLFAFLLNPLWLNATRLNMMHLYVEETRTNHLFTTPTLNLAQGESFIQEVELKNVFFLPLYYRFYLDELDLDSAAHFHIEIQDAQHHTIFEGPLETFQKQNHILSTQRLDVQQSTTYTVILTLVEAFDSPISELGFSFHLEGAMMRWAQ